MQLRIMDIIVAEGTEIECAMYTHTLIEIFRLKNEYDKRKETEEWMKKFGEMTFDELMKRERDDEE